MADGGDHLGLVRRRASGPPDPKSCGKQLAEPPISTGKVWINSLPGDLPQTAASGAL